MRKKLIFSMVLLLSFVAVVEAQTIRNASNAQAGTIESNGTVRDRSNSTMGSASGVKKEWAAVFFFFDFY